MDEIIDPSPLPFDPAEEPEYRIYASSQGGIAVVTGIVGDQAKKDALARARFKYPGDKLVVREVFETVVEIYDENGKLIYKQQ